MTDKQAHLIEIFSSAQGEGPYVGNRQVFVRFADCNLNCNYCDTDFQTGPTVKIEQTAGHQDFELFDNPIGLEYLFYYIQKLDTPKYLHHSISLTGGEPLLQTDFLREFLIQNHARFKYKMYLETNGILHENLEKVVKYLDFISMDIKIPSACGCDDSHWVNHKNFLEILAENTQSKYEYFVKAVINNDFTDEELYNLVWCIASSESNAPLILQPETKNPPEAKKLLEWQTRLLKQIPDVRIIPQTHSFLSML